MSAITDLAPYGAPGPAYTFLAKADAVSGVIIFMAFTHEEPSMEIAHDS